MIKLTPEQKKVVELLIIFFSSILAIVSLIFRNPKFIIIINLQMGSVFSYKNTEPKVDQYTQLADNLRQAYFISFRLSTNDCETNEFSLFNILWEGSTTGCDCADSADLDTENIMYKLSCEYNNKYSCKTVFSISQRTFNNLAKNSEGKEVAICGKRTNNSNQFYRIIGSQKGTCLSSQKTCGNPSKTETVICVDQDKPCPIYSYRLTTTVQNQYVEPDWGYLQINSNLHFYYDKTGANAESMPISQIVTTSGPGPCKFYVYKQTKFGNEYVLMVWERETCETDTNFIKSDIQIKEQSMYELNLSEDEYKRVSSFTGFDLINSKEIYSTFYKPFIPWKMTDRSQVFDVVDALLNIDDLLKILYYSLIVTALSVLYLVIYVNFSVLYFVVIQGYDLNSEYLFKYKKAKIFFSFVFKIASLYVAIWGFRESAKYKNVLEDIVSLKPTETVYIEQFEELSNFTSKQIYKNNFVTIITTAVNMVIDVVTLIMEIMDYYNKKKQTQVVPATLKEEEQKSKSKQHSKIIQHDNNNNKNYLEMNEINNNQNQNPQTAQSLTYIQSQYPQIIKTSSSNNKLSSVIILSDKGLVFENGLLKTKKQYSKNNL